MFDFYSKMGKFASFFADLEFCVDHLSSPWADPTSYTGDYGDESKNNSTPKYGNMNTLGARNKINDNAPVNVYNKLSPAKRTVDTSPWVHAKKRTPERCDEDF